MALIEEIKVQLKKHKTANYIIIFLIVCFSVPSYCEFQTEAHLIEIPIAYTSIARLSVGVNASFTGTQDPWPRDRNSYFQLQLFDRVHIGLSLLTKQLQSLDLKCKIVNESQHIPAVAIGSTYLTPYKFICPVSSGPGVGWEDDETYAPRNSEQYSAYIIATKDFGPYGTYSLGIGRGAWVGYGTRSNFFNSDIFSNERHNDAIGLIWGGEVLLSEPVFGVIDFDGRDFNIGIKLKDEFWQVGFAAAKIEHRLKGSPLLFPRFAMGISINTMFARHIIRSPMGTLIVSVANAETGQPMYAVVSFPGSTISPLHTKRETGSCDLYLKPGTYWVRVGTLGAYWAERKVFVSPGMTTVAYFNIRTLL